MDIKKRVKEILYTCKQIYFDVIHLVARVQLLIAQLLLFWKDLEPYRVKVESFLQKIRYKLGK